MRGNADTLIVVSCWWRGDPDRSASTLSSLFSLSLYPSLTLFPPLSSSHPLSFRLFSLFSFNSLSSSIAFARQDLLSGSNEEETSPTPIPLNPPVWHFEGMCSKGIQKERERGRGGENGRGRGREGGGKKGREGRDS